MHIVCEANPALLCSAGECTYHKVGPVRARVDQLPTECAVTAANQVAINRVAHRPRHDDPDPQGLVSTALEPVVHGTGGYRLAATSNGRAKVFGADYSVRPGEHRCD